MAEFDAVARQRLELLDGSRLPAVKRGQAAVRLDDLSELLRLPDKLKAAKVTGAPTMADYNNLFEDVSELHTRLLVVVDALRTRQGR